MKARDADRFGAVGAPSGGVIGARDWISRAHSVSESGGASLMMYGRPTPNASDARRSATRNATARRKLRFVADGGGVGVHGRLAFWFVVGSGS
jgi:hypothetical protein